MTIEAVIIPAPFKGRGPIHPVDSTAEREPEVCFGGVEVGRVYIYVARDALMVEDVVDGAVGLPFRDFRLLVSNDASCDSG